MMTNTKAKIIDYISYYGQARVYDLQKNLRISRVAIHKQLKRLLQEGLVTHVGTPPMVFYKLNSSSQMPIVKANQLPKYINQTIGANFLHITPDGKLLYGMKGFINWAQTYQKNKPLTALANEYTKTIENQKRQFSEQGWFDATLKLKESFKEVFVNRLLFQDIYSYKVFGRTKLAKLVMYAKQTGTQDLIDKISDMAKPVIEKIIKTYSVEAVAYVPPTVPRPLQFMDEFASQLNIPLPEIKLVKVMPGDIPVPQKTLSNLKERIINAQDTIYLQHIAEPSYANILLIDDVVGSGASFNETARKLKRIKIGYKNIIAFALVGNIKGYDVIREI